MTKGTTSELQTEPNLGVGDYDTDAVAYVAGLIKERDAARAENADLTARLAAVEAACESWRKRDSWPADGLLFDLDEALAAPAPDGANG